VDYYNNTHSRDFSFHLNNFMSWLFKHVHVQSIPGGFIKQHKLEKQRATLRHANRSWSVRLGGSNGHVRGALCLFFSAGWRAFARETHLHIGDVCMFELIDRDDIVFEVSILSGEDLIYIVKNEYLRCNFRLFIA